MMMITLRMNMRQTMITMIAVNEDDEGEDDSDRSKRYDFYDNNAVLNGFNVMVL